MEVEPVKTLPNFSAIAKRNRRKGHGYERKIVQEFKEMGWTEAVTSRLESKRADDNGIDLCYTDPFAIQCKNSKAVNYIKVLDHMVVKDKLKVVFHKKDRTELVVMTKADFYKILTSYNHGTKTRGL
jgi:Holliday junction resolvase